MIRKFAWDFFTKTGSINTYLEFSKIRGIENELKVKSDENIKGEWDNNCRK